MQAKYWQFYWPLALTAVAMLMSPQVQNGVLARYPDGTRAIAVFALAMGTFGAFGAATLFIRQLTTVLARCLYARRRVMRFVIGVSLGLTAPLALIAYTPMGPPVLTGVFAIRDAALAEVTLYLRGLCPIIIVLALRHYYSGLLVQCRRTGVLTVSNFVQVGVMVALLIVGLKLEWSPVAMIVIATDVSFTVHLVFLVIARYAVYEPPATPEHEALTYREIWSFFWPVTITGVMFALSRPIIYAFVQRVDDPEPKVAALRVAFDFAMIFHVCINQFRDVMVTFSKDDPAGVRRFMTHVMLICTAAMVITAASPLSGFVFADLMMVEPSVVGMAKQALLVLCLIPLIVTIRNYYHGQLMTHRRTASMAVGAILRAGGIYVLAGGALSMGWLNHITAAAMLLIGFATEAVVVVINTRVWPIPTVEELKADVEAA